MKTSFNHTAMALLLLLGSSGAALRADTTPNDLAALARYADQLNQHGIGGERFVELVDDSYWGIHPDRQQPGMGSYVLEMQARGLHGRALADALQAEQQRRRGLGHLDAKNNGNAQDPPASPSKPR